MINESFSIKARVWLYPGKIPWHFVTIEKPIAKEIKKENIWPRRGFGSIPVRVTIGETTWKTSIFPEKKGTYLLPIKKEVRDKENFTKGDMVELELEVRD